MGMSNSITIYSLNIYIFLYEFQNFYRVPTFFILYSFKQTCPHTSSSNSFGAKLKIKIN